MKNNIIEILQQFILVGRELGTHTVLCHSLIECTQIQCHNCIFDPLASFEPLLKKYSN